VIRNAILASILIVAVPTGEEVCVCTVQNLSLFIRLHVIFEIAGKARFPIKERSHIFNQVQTSDRELGVNVN
jgi:hypothetical protein